MRKWDLMSGAARLELAYRTLMGTWNEVHEQWGDETAKHFHDRHLHPLEPRARRAMEAIKRLNEIFATAERQLEDEE